MNTFPSPRRSGSRPRHGRRLRAATLLALACAGSVQAATLTWDADTATAGAQDGTGTWNLTNPNWYNPATTVNTT